MLTAEAFLLQHLADRAQNGFLIFRQFPAQDDQLGTETVGHVDHAGSQSVDISVYNSAHDHVAGLGLAVDLLGRHFNGGCPHGFPLQAGYGSIGFQTAPAAAGAELTAVHNDHMAQLTAAEAASAEDIAVQQDADAYAGTDPQHDHILIILADARDRFAQGGAVRVVADDNRYRDHLTDDFRHIDPVPAYVVGIADDTSLSVDGPGHADADAYALVNADGVFLQQIQGQPADIGKVFLRGNIGLCLCFYFIQQLILEVDQADPGLGAADINTDPDGSRLLTDGGDQSIALAFYNISAAAGGQEEAVALLEGQGLAVIGNGSFAFHEQDADEGFLRDGTFHLLHEGAVQVQLINGKVIAVRHMGIAAVVLDDRNAPGDRQGLLDMQVTLFAVLADTAVIVDTVGDIGVLLDLGDQDVLADGVQGT